jgi:FtsH-binding integral membrane protein
MTSSDRSAERRFHGRLFLLLGVGLAVLGVAGYVVQISLQRLMAPWYMPVLATLGGVLVIISLREKRTFWRVFAVVGVGLLAAGEWGILLAFRLPAYTGPITVGRSFPAFETSQADGTLFTQSKLTGDRNSVLVFFRGRW